ncbi:hypothetical protein BN946_scf184760.g14 [Trametes cinnabarina]|uniref:CCHC-type domain-containing protein n=1 Tax=Pycnoporus cinnabarinus TaxID=5643 RepID=A0A060S7T8_PYCCI|nr:hypothetical protein BN946_scf184760.g14 [Trametes cinnabarina]
MASQQKAPEIIDLTEPEIIELNSDGELVSDSKPSANTISVTSLAQREQAEESNEAQSDQAKKKRKKRKRKLTSAAVSEKEEGEIGTSSAEVSRPQSRGSPDTNNIELHISTVPEDAKPPSAGEGGKKTLVDRLGEPESKNARHGGQSRQEKRERREKEKPKERKRDKERTKERERDREGERDGRRRSRSRERERGAGRSRKRSRSRDREKRRRDKTKEEVSGAPLFFEDVTPADVPVAVKPQSVGGPSNSVPQAGSSTNATSGEKSTDALLLPAHVVITEGDEDADTSELKVPSLEGSDDEDYIDYLDYDDNRRAGMIRYWELDKVAAAETAKPSRFVCKNCGAEGEHKTYECPVLIGHINRDCPNRAATRAGAYTHYQDCNRCGARTHQTNECPTLWRIYEYVGDEERQEILREREAKRTLALGQGGEGYIATDEWCYNCGGCGHLGDDCNDRPKPFDAPREPSAFSLYNILSGPFSSEAPRPSKRVPRDWETASAFADGYGFVAPMDVGKQGRKKERARLERRAREIEADEDEDDWFGSARSKGRNGSGGGGGGAGGGGGVGGGGWNGYHRKSPRRDRGGHSKPNSSGGGGKIRFDFSHASMDRDGRDRDGGGREWKRQRVSYDDLAGPPPRETDSMQIRGAAKNDRDPPRGPRYRGGYSR